MKKLWICFLVWLSPFLLMGQSTNLMEGIGIKEWTWTDKKLLDGDGVVINFTMTNNTPYKLLNARFRINLWGADGRTILQKDKRLTAIDVIEFDDSGYNFVPSNHIKKADIFIPLRKNGSTEVGKISFSLVSVDRVEMTVIDSSLTKVGDYINLLESQDKEVPPLSYAAQARFLEQKRKLKGK